MKKILISLAALILIAGCSQNAKKDTTLAQINNYTISQQEFEEEFKASNYARDDTLKSRKDFLDLLIQRKLILQDAQAQGLDKNREFLKAIERFWEQSLLKLALDKQAKEISAKVSVSDEEIESKYQELLKEGKADDKTYAQMYNQIKWDITKSKDSGLMNNWLVELQKRAKIKVNEKLIGQGRGQK